MSFGLKQFEFHNPVGWRQISPGIEELTLNDDGNGRRTVLQKYAPGASTSIVHEHTYFEEVYLAEGSLTDITLNQTWQKGAYAFRHPGMKHGPYISVNGCVMFVVSTPSSN
ncbi:chrR cupin-like domain-containing protein [Ditylenchus destructor]|uniref:ChrR cupin-like domain-containing protein n=1 Tax=Ditylenchus destructor TaxID=166010 RepID=A0AAD4MXU1_9BILA|nr:chrR cupin-like domain-containing protein [Ditylenchus destructor]